MTERMGPIGGLALAAALAAVGWLALHGGRRDARERGGEFVAAPSPLVDEEAPASVRARARPAVAAPARPADTTPGSIVGRVESGDPAVPDVGRRVTLLENGGRSRGVLTDGVGAFAFDDVAPAVAHEVLVEAEGCGPERITGLVLGPRERRDIGTLSLAAPGRFDVHVTDDHGAPIGGALQESAAQWQQTTADGEGRFTFDALSPGGTELVACAPGGAPLDVASVAVGEIGEIDLVLPRTATLTGRVTDADTGVPVAGVVVSVAAPGGGWDQGSLGRMATSDADGRWTLDQLPPGMSLRTSIVVPPPWTASRFDGSTQQTLGEGALRTLDLTVLRGAAITGRVTCDGAPVAFAEVEAITFAPGWTWVLRGVDARAGADGTFRIEGVLPGPVAVFAFAPGDDSYTARNAFIDAIRKDEVTRSRDVTELAAGASAERDVAITRTPKDDSEFALMERRMSEGRRPIRVRCRIKTADGLPLLRARAGVSASDYDDLARMFARPVPASGVYEVTESLDADGKVPSRRQVRALNPAEPEADFWRADLDDLGRFEIRGLSEGEWLVESIEPGCMTVGERVPLGTFRAGAKDLELRLPK